MVQKIQLDKMTISDKLRALEDIRDDLQRTPEEIPSPAWPADVLRARRRPIREGKSQFNDWLEAKHRVREREEA
ncbi:MAG: addiction module protein [Deltaproteobacteria bacterium]|nr:addiction module protein [Deltaproteobacteria bacterium]